MKRNIAFALAGILFFGCNSKNIEKTPDGVTIQGLSLDERIANKALTDNAIERIQRGSRQIRRILQLVRRANNSEPGDDYTPIDLIIDVNEELKNRMPENSNGAVVRFGAIEIPISQLSQECRNLETSLQTQQIYSDGVIQTTVNDEDSSLTVVGQQLVYSFRVCDQSDFVPGFTVELVNNDLKFKIHNTNFLRIFQSLIARTVEQSVNCNFVFGDSRIIDSVQCSNIEVKLSSTEIALLKRINFSSSGDVRLEGNAEIYEDSQIKATAEIEILSGGDVRFDMRAVDRNAETVIPAN